MAARSAASSCSRQPTTSTTSALFLQHARRTMVTRTLPLMNSDDLPYHIVMGMPALSPTMESGVLAEWYVKEGDSFVAGDALAKIETDKASIDFEAQDDGYVAKLFVEAGGAGEDIKVGTPIMVTVEEADDVGAFANFAPPAVEAAPAAKEAAAAPTPPPAAAAAAAATPPPPPPPKVEAAPVAPPPPPAAAAAAAAPVAAAPAPVSAGWGRMATTSSPLIKTLRKEQQAYIDKYGTTGQPTL